MLEYEVLRGGEFLDILTQLIDSARRRVYIATYIASLSPATEDVYYALAKRCRLGVDVKVLLDGVSGKADKYNSRTAEFLSSLGVPVARSNRFMHVKLYIVDDRVIVGSHNLTATPRGGYEVSVMLNSRRAASELGDFYLAMYGGGHPRDVRYFDLLEDGTPFEVLSGHRILDMLIGRASSCTRRIKILMYIASTSSATRRFYRLLGEKARSGVGVTVVLDGSLRLSRYYNERAYRYMKEAGVEKVVLTSRHTHAKVVVLDNLTVIGSHNLTSSSIAGRAELSVCIWSPSLSGAMDYTVESIYEDEYSSQGSRG